MPFVNSSHFLPINSIIFQNRSTPDLRSSTQSTDLYAKFAVSEAALPKICEEHEDITALPSKLSKATKEKSKKEKEKKHRGAKGFWARFAKKLKVPFKGLKSRGKARGSPSGPEMVIGSPTSFQHVETWGANGLRSPSGRFGAGEQDFRRMETGAAEDDNDDEWEDMDE